MILLIVHKVGNCTWLPLLPEEICLDNFDTFLLQSEPGNCTANKRGETCGVFSLPEITVGFISSFSGLRAALDSYFQLSRTQEPATGPVPRLEPLHIARHSEEHSSDEIIEVSDSDSSTSAEEEEAVEAAAPLLPSAQETPPAARSGGLCYIWAV